MGGERGVKLAKDFHKEAAMEGPAQRDKSFAPASGQREKLNNTTGGKREITRENGYAWIERM